MTTDATQARLADATILLIEAAQHGGLHAVLRQRINGFLGETDDIEPAADTVKSSTDVNQDAITGWAHAGGRKPCPACRGTKHRARGNGHTAPCRDCNGTGIAGVRSHAELEPEADRG
jgi:hypothetical protein